MEIIELVRKDSVLDRHLNGLNRYQPSGIKVSFWVYEGKKSKSPSLLWTFGGAYTAIKYENSILYESTKRKDCKSVPTSYWRQAAKAPNFIKGKFIEYSKFFLTYQEAYVFSKKGDITEANTISEDEQNARILIPSGLSSFPGKILIHPNTGVSIRPLGHVYYNLDYIFRPIESSNVFPNSKSKAVNDYLSYFLSLRIPGFDYHGSLLVPKGSAGDLKIVPILVMDPSFVDGSNYVIRVDKIRDIAVDIAELEKEMIKRALGLSFSIPVVNKSPIQIVSSQWDWMEKPYEETQKENMEELMNAFS